jgi:hypothetical protein
LLPATYANFRLVQRHGGSLILQLPIASWNVTLLRDDIERVVLDHPSRPM